MFNPEKILGGLIKGGLSGGRGMGTKAAIGLGMLGIAMEAIEHFANQTQTAPSPHQAAPPPPPGIPGAVQGSPLPPPPPVMASPPPPPTAPVPATAVSSGDAVLLIRSMIAAAYADGQLDDDERRLIMERLGSVGLDEEERRFIEEQLATPPNLDDIISQVNTPALARQIYTASLLAITVDTPAERDYLKNLARRLFLSDAMVASVHAELGLAPA